MKVFVDTSAWFAFYDRADHNHAAARAISDYLKTERATLILSDFILAESLTLMRYRLGHALAVRFGAVMLESRLAELIAVDERVRHRAWEIFKRYEDKEFSFTDCTSFAVMEQLRVEQAFAFDRHFEQYGFRVLNSTTGL